MQRTQSAKLGMRPRSSHDVLFADESDRDNMPAGECDRCAVKAFEHENPFGMMPERAVPKIGRYEFALVHPGVKREEVLRNTSPFSDRGEGMVIRMCH